MFASHIIQCDCPVLSLGQHLQDVLCQKDEKCFSCSFLHFRSPEYYGKFSHANLITFWAWISYTAEKSNISSGACPNNHQSWTLFSLRTFILLVQCGYAACSFRNRWIWYEIERKSEFGNGNTSFFNHSWLDEFLKIITNVQHLTHWSYTWAYDYHHRFHLLSEGKTNQIELVLTVSKYNQLNLWLILYPYRSLLSLGYL